MGSVRIAVTTKRCSHLILRFMIPSLRDRNSCPIHHCISQETIQSYNSAEWMVVMTSSWSSSHPNTFAVKWFALVSDYQIPSLFVHSLLASPENQWGSLQGRSQVAGVSHLHLTPPPCVCYAGYSLTLHASCWASRHHLWLIQCLSYTPLHSCSLSPPTHHLLCTAFPSRVPSSQCAYCTPSLMFLCIYLTPSLPPPVSSHLPGCGSRICTFPLISTLTLVVGSRQEVALSNHQIIPVNHSNRDCSHCIAKQCGHALELHQLMSEIPVPIAIVSQGLQFLWK